MRDEVKLILPTSWKPERKAFLTALGVSINGLGEQLLGTVYDALFVSSIDIKSEFKKYYSVEYANLAEYLDIRYGEIVNEEDLDSDYVFLVTWLPLIVDSIYEENKLDIVLECIKKLEKEHNEDQV